VIISTILLSFSPNDFFMFVKTDSAFYIPPKQSQALLQGGTFVFRGNDTLFAHYDPSTAAHASMDQVIEIAYQ
jgi:hypothetical protein